MLDQLIRVVDKSSLLLQPPPSSLGLDDDQYDSNLNSHDEFEIPLLRFDGMGDRDGQKTFLQRLMNEVDPASAVLRKLGWPKRPPRFAINTVMIKNPVATMNKTW